MNEKIATDRWEVVLPGAVGFWRLSWGDEGVLALVPVGPESFRPFDAEGEGEALLPPELREGWRRFWRGQDPAVPLVGAVPPFCGRVYDLVRHIPAGEVRTYGHVAAALGCVGGARAVGQALRRNPWALFVPCHRVLRGDGELAGYGGPAGIPLKRALLRFEGVEVLPGGRLLEK